MSAAVMLAGAVASGLVLTVYALQGTAWLLGGVLERLSPFR